MSRCKKAAQAVLLAILVAAAMFGRADAQASRRMPSGWRLTRPYQSKVVRGSFNYQGYRQPPARR